MIKRALLYQVLHVKVFYIFDLLLEKRTEIFGFTIGLLIFLHISEGFIPNIPNVLDQLDRAIVVSLFELPLNDGEIDIVIHNLSVILMGGVRGLGKDFRAWLFSKSLNELLTLSRYFLPYGGCFLFLEILLNIAKIFEICWLFLSLRDSLLNRI